MVNKKLKFWMTLTSCSKKYKRTEISQKSDGNICSGISQFVDDWATRKRQNNVCDETQHDFAGHEL